VGRIGVALGEARSAKVDENFYAQMGPISCPGYSVSLTPGKSDTGDTNSTHWPREEPLNSCRRVN
jgi:hypothetical protein